MKKPNEECRYCTQRRVGCHSGCKVDEKIREYYENIRRNKAKDKEFSQYVRSDSKNKRSYIY